MGRRPGEDARAPDRDPVGSRVGGRRQPSLPLPSTEGGPCASSRQYTNYVDPDPPAAPAVRSGTAARGHCRNRSTPASLPSTGGVPVREREGRRPSGTSSSTASPSTRTRPPRPTRSTGSRSSTPTRRPRRRAGTRRRRRLVEDDASRARHAPPRKRSSSSSRRPDPGALPDLRRLHGDPDELVLKLVEQGHDLERVLHYERTFGPKRPEIIEALEVGRRGVEAVRSRPESGHPSEHKRTRFAREVVLDVEPHPTQGVHHPGRTPLHRTARSLSPPRLRSGCGRGTCAPTAWSRSLRRTRRSARVRLPGEGASAQAAWSGTSWGYDPTVVSGFPLDRELEHLEASITSRRGTWPCRRR